MHTLTRTKLAKQHINKCIVKSDVQESKRNTIFIFKKNMLCFLNYRNLSLNCNYVMQMFVSVCVGGYVTVLI